MYELSLEAQFAAAHQLRRLVPGGEPLHGHTWRVQVVLRADRVGEDGVAVDFEEVRRQLQAAVQPLDHTCLNTVPPFTTVEPSAENVAKWLYDTLSTRLTTERATVSKVTVWESETAAASYWRE